MQTVVETPGYLGDADALSMSESERFEILTSIAKHLEAGVVIAGTGGARKITTSYRKRKVSS